MDNSACGFGFTVPSRLVWLVKHPGGELLRVPAPAYVVEELWRGLPAGNAELASEYGEFRVVTEGLGELVWYAGMGEGWNEDQATLRCYKLQEHLAAVDAGGSQVWIEHQNPETGEWKRW